MPGQRERKSTSASREGDWLQLNVALRRHDGEALASARAVFAELTPRVRAWRRRGMLTRFFFMRKEPDLRLRLQGPAPRDDLLKELTGVLRGLKRQGAVRSFFPSVYEPEVHLFGGPDGMRHAHTYFDRDTSAWFAFDRLWATGRGTLAPEVITAAVMNDLFLTTLHDVTEVWDVWWNLVTLIGTSSLPTSPPMPLHSLDSLPKTATSQELRVVRHYKRANEALATGLIGTWERGRLECGLRAVLPFVAMFHFHRYGLDGRRQAALAESMRRAWNPRQELRGADG